MNSARFAWTIWRKGSWKPRRVGKPTGEVSMKCQTAKEFAGAEGWVGGAPWVAGVEGWRAGEDLDLVSASPLINCCWCSERGEKGRE